MSLQDDYYDIAEELKDGPLEVAFERIWFAFCDYETREMVANGQYSEQDYADWKQKRLEELGAMQKT